MTGEATRYRTHTDDVIDAVKRGVDIEVIRELGVLYDLVVFGEHQFEAEDSLSMGYAGEAITKVSQALNINLSWSWGQNDINACYLEIRYRLTGHREMTIHTGDAT